DNAAKDYRAAMDNDPLSESASVARQRLNVILDGTAETHKEDVSRNARFDEIQSLTKELIRIGRKPRPDLESSSHFLLVARNRAVQIGKRLDELGGLKL